MSLTKRTPIIYLLGFLHLFLGINGIAGGLLLMIRPDGSLLSMQTGWLENSPFSSYLIPGFLLFSFLGLFPLLTLIGLFTKKEWVLMQYLNLYRDKHWSWAFSIFVGIIAIVWITIQLIMTQYFWIQPVIIFNGLSILVVTLLPGIMKHYIVKER
jgi:hypothetical protein